MYSEFSMKKCDFPYSYVNLPEGNQISFKHLRHLCPDLVESPLRRWGNHVWKPRRVQIQVMEIFTRSNPKISEGFESYAATVSTELSQ
jgi:hypothetical protein